MAKRQLTIEPATGAHATKLAAHIRPEDAAELMASHALTPTEGLAWALRASKTARVVLDGERVVAMFGVDPVPGMERAASVWLLAGRLVRRLPVAFMKLCAQELPKLTQAWGLLFNMVWAQNTQALRWVRALGFEVLEPIPFGPSGLPFHPIRLTGRG